MSGEWSKSSISELIRVYKEQENLYNPKHKLYFNKQARNNSLIKMLNAVKRSRPESTLPDISKKIQTLRTQFGQEVSKIEKSTSLGEELIYRPKIWWFSHLDWIGNFMKTRTDSTPLLEKVSKVTKVEKTEENSEILFEFEEPDESENLEHFTTEIEYAEFEADTTPEAPPPSKKQKTYQTSKALRSLHLTDTQDDVGTVEYTLINEDDPNDVVHTHSSKRPSQFVEFHETDLRQNDKLKRRSKAFGKYVSALLMDISDDRIFFELQRNITTSIHEANMKQTERKS